MRKVVFLFGALALIAVSAVVAKGSAGLLQAGGPAPPPPTPPPGGNVTSNVSPPGANPPYLQNSSALINTTIHMSQINYSYHVGSPDPNNGREVFGDVWIQFGSDGQPKLFAGRYTLSDGTVVQTIRQTPSSLVVTYGSPVPSGKPDGSTTCRTDLASSPQAMRNLAPPFVNLGSLPQVGFSPGSSFTFLQPTTPPFLGLEPKESIPATSGPLSHFQEVVQAKDGSKITRMMAVDPGSGRLVAARSTSVSVNGVLIGEDREAYGRIDIFSQAVVVDVFNPSGLSEVC